MPDGLRHHVLSRLLERTEILSCPPLQAGGLASDIRARGNVPVAVGAACMFELTPDDIRETWESTCALKEQVAGAMVAEISHRLCAELSDEAEDEAMIASDAAACLFLALRHHNLPITQALQGCRILWDDQTRAEAVEYLA